jgi:hypothetical protein
MYIPLTDRWMLMDNYLISSSPKQIVFYKVEKKIDKAVVSMIEKAQSRSYNAPY